ncbi:uridine phosphorylase [Psittacicella melopsittaci]|uniref:Uridine phosphorylase n=1 Tax=Psittacicella melopsittaci TaxID=2028576 RepID=A0A3A1Y5P1_9GAMM|nr:uridine phosphorylase [Psittacicella melopsittaci]RIY31507.1 uridine phosphorylase [Psittacicella melopsittaci]
MSNIQATVFHLGLNKEVLEGAKIALIPGDPGRVAKMASYLDNPKPLASNREYNSYLGYINNVPVVVCSTGIGGPSTSIAVEELAQLGVDTFIRVGTTGAIQEHINIGDVIIATGCVRLDGASYHFAPEAYPAVANYDVLHALVEGAKKSDVTYYTGITASSDTFYPGQERYDTFRQDVPKHMQGKMALWQQLHVLNFEMEGATLFTQAASLGLRAGMVAGVIVNRTKNETPDEKQAKIVEDNGIKVAVEALKTLIG